MNPDKYGFGVALDYLKSGRRIAREGWNGKGMWLCLVEIYEVVHTATEVDYFGSGELLPWIGMKTEDDKFVPWLASQTDILASDWVLL